MFLFVLRWPLIVSVFAYGTILPMRMLHDLSIRANASAQRYERIEARIMTTRTHLARDTPAWYLGASHAILLEARNLSRRAIRGETVATMLVEAMNMTAAEAAVVLPSVQMPAALLCDLGPTKSSTTAEGCSGVNANLNSKYRTQSGQCNNPSHPTWGAALGAYTRLLPAEYADGVSLPRISNLPSARNVSLAVHSGGPDKPHPYLMALAALFGQFLAHDLSFTPKVELPNSAKLRCCDVNYEYFHPECFPIKVDDQPTRCMEYARSAPHPGGNDEGCGLGPRQQINQATSFLDLSPLYGISKATMMALRSGVRGLMQTQRRDLPMPSMRPENCRFNTPALPCFFSGDERINEHPGLALIHILFLREHNKVAVLLASLNPHWDDERLFQEARRVVIAELQHITYNEFLPVVLGESALDRWNLRLVPAGYFEGYNPRVDPTLSNAASSAGLSFIAAITPKTLDLINTRSNTLVKSGERTLLSSFYAPQELYEAGAIDRLIAGATAGHSRKPAPPGLNEILLGRYFHDGKSVEAPIDLVSQLIQRCRDHGLPSYTTWREFCGLRSASDFDDLRGTMSKEAIQKLRGVYGSVREIDLLTGAFAETVTEGSVVGPTFSCLLGRTFRNIRIGDRYWYENGNTPGAFSAKQLEEIRKTSMARILCANGDRLGRVQPRSFILTDPFLNPIVNCSDYEGRLDLSSWKDGPTESQSNP